MNTQTPTDQPLLKISFATIESLLGQIDNYRSTSFIDLTELDSAKLATRISMLFDARNCAWAMPPDLGERICGQVMALGRPEENSAYETESLKYATDILAFVLEQCKGTERELPFQLPVYWYAARQALAQRPLDSNSSKSTDDDSADRALIIDKFLEKAENAAQSFADAVDSNSINEALEALWEIEVNADIKPWVFDSAKLDQFSLILQSLVPPVCALRTKCVDLMVNEISYSKRFLNEPKTTTNVQHQHVLNPGFKFTITKSLGIGKLWTEMERWQEAVEALARFMGGNTKDLWPVSSNSIETRMFNCRNLSELVTYTDWIGSVDARLPVCDRLAELMGVKSYFVDTPGIEELDIRMNNFLYAANVFQIHAFLHFVFGFAISGVQQGNIARSKELLLNCLDKIISVLERYESCNLELAESLTREFVRRGESPESFAIADLFHFKDTVSFESEPINARDIPVVFRKLQDKSVKTMQKWYSSRSLLHIAFSDSAELISKELESDFATQHYSEYNYIVPKSLPTTYAPDSGIQVLMRSGPGLANFKCADKFLVNYPLYMEQINDWIPFEDFISEVADNAILGENAERNYGVNLNKLCAIESVVEKESNLSQMLENKFDRFVSYLIGRRIILGISKQNDGIGELALRFGFLARKDGNVKKGKRCFGTYMRERCGLRLDDCQHPFRAESSVHNVVGELKWLKKYRS